MSKSYNVEVGPVLPSLLTVLFVGLKLTHYIDWSWWWVLSPLWIGLGVALLIMLLMLAIVASAGTKIKRSAVNRPTPYNKRRF